jgi:hypothetical protein
VPKDLAGKDAIQSQWGKVGEEKNCLTVFCILVKARATAPKSSVKRVRAGLYSGAWISCNRGQSETPLIGDGRWGDFVSSKSLNRKLEKEFSPPHFTMHTKLATCYQTSLWDTSLSTNPLTSSCVRHVVITEHRKLEEQRNITKQNKPRGLSPRENYTDRATAACQRNRCQLLRIESAAWSAQRIPTAVLSGF